jgi:predicted GNAT family acetyltransferase
VYTPPERRGQGFGGAVTAAVSQSVKEAGVAEVVLFTDLGHAEAFQPDSILPMT